jgi:hypothetical protein
MTNRVAIKTTFDATFGSLMALGIAGLSFAIYNQNVIAGLFGFLCVLIAIILNYTRNQWNENEKTKMQGRMEEVVGNRLTAVKPKVIRTIVKKVDKVEKVEKVVEKIVGKGETDGGTRIVYAPSEIIK